MLDQLSKRFVYPVYWKARRLSVPAYREYYGKSQWLSREELDELQWAALQNLLRHAYENVPFYRARFKALGAKPEDIRTRKDFSSLPYLTKDDINSCFPDLIACNLSIADMIRDSSGGSTGKNVTFYEDRNELSHRFAATLRSDSWAGLYPGSKHAVLWGSPMDIKKASSLRRQLDKVLLRRLFISSFDLSDVSLDRTLEQIREFKPEVLLGYASPLHRLSRYVHEHGTGELGFSSIISSAETLHHHQRQEIEKNLHARVYNRYGCREFGPIATECEKGCLHILTDRLYIEFLPIPSEESEFQEIVITDLHKYGMPFIRYRIGDVGLPSGDECSCGRGLPVMKCIEGRTYDMVIGTNGNFVSGTFFSLLIRSIPGVDQFQVYQDSRERLLIKIRTRPGFDPGFLEKLPEAISRKCGADMQVSIETVGELPASGSGKRRYVISDIAREYFSR